MFFRGFAAAVFAVLLTSPLQALSITDFRKEDGTGRFNFGYFEVKNLEYSDGRLEFPLEKGEYKNIKIMTPAFRDKLAACFENCVFEKKTKPAFTVSDSRFSGESLWIADVLFDGELAVTFLVSKNAKGFRITKPFDFIFTDGTFEKELKEFLKQNYELHKQR